MEDCHRVTTHKIPRIPWEVCYSRIANMSHKSPPDCAEFSPTPWENFYPRTADNSHMLLLHRGQVPHRGLLPRRRGQAPQHGRPLPLHARQIPHHGSLPSEMKTNSTHGQRPMSRSTRTNPTHHGRADVASPSTNIPLRGGRLSSATEQRSRTSTLCKAAIALPGSSPTSCRCRCRGCFLHAEPRTKSNMLSLHRGHVPYHGRLPLSRRQNVTPPIRYLRRRRAKKT